MHLFKFIVSFIAVGGATYALFKIQKTPLWLIAVSCAMSLAALITAIAHLPEAAKALEDIVGKIRTIPLPHVELPESPVRRPPFSEPPSPSYTARALPSQPQCAAVVTSNKGAWGASAGRGLPCLERLQRARSACAARTRGVCGNYATGFWVAAVHCGMRVPYGFTRNSFAGRGSSEYEAFEDAFAHAAHRSFPYQSCRRLMAMSAEDAIAKRYN